MNDPTDKWVYPHLHGQRLNKRFSYSSRRSWWPKWIVSPANWLLCGLMGCDRTLMYTPEDWSADDRYGCVDCSRTYPVPPHAKDWVYRDRTSHELDVSS